MADDWQPGDLALCVRAGEMQGRIYTWGGEGLREGGVYTVAGVGVCPDEGDAILWLENDDGPGGRAAIRFRKIRPHTPDAEDAETIALLTGKPAQVPA